jgi:hypothetical protein
VIVVHPSYPIYLYMAWRLFGQTPVISMMEAAYGWRESDHFDLLSCFWSFRLSRFLFDLYADERLCCMTWWTGQFVFESCIKSEFVTLPFRLLNYSCNLVHVKTSNIFSIFVRNMWFLFRENLPLNLTNLLVFAYQCL